MDLNFLAKNFFCPSKNGKVSEKKCNRRDECEDNEELMICKEICMNQGIEDILTSTNCMNKSISDVHGTLGTKLMKNGEESNLTVLCWLLVGLNAVQLSVTAGLLVTGYFMWKGNGLNSDPDGKTPLENDFEMIENDMYCGTA